MDEKMEDRTRMETFRRIRCWLVRDSNGSPLCVWNADFKFEMSILEPGWTVTSATWGYAIDELAKLVRL